MTTLVTADEKGRLCIKGTEKGQKYPGQTGGGRLVGGPGAGNAAASARFPEPAGLAGA